MEVSERRGGEGEGGRHVGRQDIAGSWLCDVC